MRALKHQLRSHEDKVADAHERRKEIAKAEMEAERDLLRLTSEADSLREVVGAAEEKSEAIAGERKAAQAVLQEVMKERERLRKRLRADERFGAIRDAVAAVDKTIAMHRSRAAVLARRVKKAQRAADEAAMAAAEIGTSLREKRELLRTLPERIKATRGRLAAQAAAMKRAADGGRMWELYTLDAALAVAIEDLRSLTDRRAHRALIGSLFNDGGLAQASERAEDDANALAELKAELAAARRDLDNSVQDRDRIIAARLQGGRVPDSPPGARKRAPDG